MPDKDTEATNQIRNAIDLLSEELAKCEDYAWSWHCNVAMPICDEGVDSDVANKAAARIMSIIFGVDTLSIYEQHKMESRRQSLASILGMPGDSSWDAVFEKVVDAVHKVEVEKVE